ncbi:unnamed protein product [Caenorhabditis sp. 36 PRJEB53466]|nr:unnamed protein product [Caenorhabditis sp. 36 PRJEB53466]
MSVDIKTVLSLLLLQFKDLGTLPHNPKATRKEKKLAEKFKSLLEQAADGDVEIEEDDKLVLEEDGDWEPPVFEPLDDNEMISPHLTFRFGSRWVSKTDVEKAISYRCANMAFIKCARCLEYRCFDHFVVVDHHLCPNI